MLVLKRIISFLLLITLLMISSSVNKAVASWVAFNTHDLIQRADVILIGYIVGPVDEEKSKSELPMWRTFWKVRVYYYLKGNYESQEIIVATPGAKNKAFITSIDYRLDAWGKEVLLFLQERKGTFEPISPQGVVSLLKNDYSPKSGEKLTGKRILQEFAIIVNPHINNLGELEKYIIQNNSIVIPKPGTISGFDKNKTSNYFPVIFITLTILALIVIGGWLLKKRSIS